MWFIIIANIWVENDFCADVHKDQGKTSGCDNYTYLLISGTTVCDIVGESLCQLPSRDIIFLFAAKINNKLLYYIEYCNRCKLSYLFFCVRNYRAYRVIKNLTWQ